MRDRKIGLAIGLALLLAVAVRHPSADIRILTHDSSDPTPHRMQAAVDLGIVAGSILVTWTANRLSR